MKKSAGNEDLNTGEGQILSLPNLQLRESCVRSPLNHSVEKKV